MLRPLKVGDARDIQRLAGERLIADTTLLIPHPYPDGAAEPFIAAVLQEWVDGKSAVFAITLVETHELCGTMGLMIERRHERAELGYWISVPLWGKGLATEAAGRILEFGFDKLNLNKICAHHFSRNPASGRVLQKIGMQHEGRLLQHVRRWDQFEDLECYGILREQWGAIRAKG